MTTTPTTTTTSAPTFDAAKYKQTTRAQWETALARALSHCYVVQERVAVSEEPYPLYDAEGGGDLVFADLHADLDPFIFGTEVTGARWDEHASRWRVETDRGAFSAQVLVSAVMSANLNTR